MAIEVGRCRDSRPGSKSSWFVGGPRCSPGIVDTIESSEPSHSMMVDDFAQSTEVLEGTIVSDLPGDPWGSRKTLPFAPHRKPNPSAARHLRHQFCLPTEPRISANRPSTVASEPFSHVQPNAKPESPFIQSPAKSGGLTVSCAEPKKQRPKFLANLCFIFEVSARLCFIY